MILAAGVDTIPGLRDTPEDKPALRLRNDIGCCVEAENEETKFSQSECAGVIFFPHVKSLGR